MEQKIQIRNKHTGEVIIGIEANSKKEAVESAIKLKADLSNAKLSGADLFKAKLSVADLSGADLSMADLSNADLSNADLSNCHNWNTNFKYCKVTKNTKKQILISMNFVDVKN